jgi:FKBP-type peptidyl-prolyl cis-trans isomerase
LALSERIVQFAEIGVQCDNTNMRKFLVTAVNILAVGALLLANAPAQDTPPATTQSGSPAASTKAQTPAAKRPSTASRGAAPLTLKTQTEKFSYALGMKMGANMHKQSVPVDPNIFARGMKDAIAGGKTLLTDEQAQAAITEVQNGMRQKQQEKMQKEAEVNKKAGQDFLAANKGKEGVITLPSGLQYKILKAGTGPKPASSDSVVCNYRGTLIDGKEFDSSVKGGKPVTFPVSGVIKGWTEALQLMPVGSKWQLFIPSDLAYGDRGAGADIGPGATLIFEVELLSIEDKNKSKEKEKEKK